MKTTSIILGIVQTMGLCSSLAAQEIDGHRASSMESTSFLFPTALQQPVGTKNVKGLYFFGWELNKSFTESASAGFRLLAPIGVLGGGPRFKLTTALSEQIHIGFTGEVGAFSNLWAQSSRSHGFYYASGSMITLGDHDAAITMGGYILGGGFFREQEHSYGYESDHDSNHNFVTLANINLHKRLTESVKAMIDIGVPLSHKNGALEERSAFVTYGARIGGESMSGDIGFIIPVHNGMEDTLRLMPLGIPLVSLNFAF